MSVSVLATIALHISIVGIENHSRLSRWGLKLETVNTRIRAKAIMSHCNQQAATQRSNLCQGFLQTSWKGNIWVFQPQNASFSMAKTKQNKTSMKINTIIIHKHKQSPNVPFMSLTRWESTPRTYLNKCHVGHFLITFCHCAAQELLSTAHFRPLPWGFPSRACNLFCLTPCKRRQCNQILLFIPLKGKKKKLAVMWLA